MTSNGSDISSATGPDQSTGSWKQIWDNEIPEPSESSELTGLVEDKDIAARAVAFVISSTRKGIVPLCSDVATLLRQKKSLEKRVRLLKLENERLRHEELRSGTCSSCSQPMSKQATNRPCSQCSRGYCSYHANSSSEREGLEGEGRDYSAFASTPRERCRPHQLSGREGCSSQLPEMTAVPNRGIQKITPGPRGYVSPGMASVSPTGSTGLMESQVMEALQLNTTLAEELGGARKEIEQLSARVKELEMQQLARKFTEGHEAGRSKVAEGVNTGVQDSPASSYSSSQGSAPLAGCLCRGCQRRLQQGRHPPPAASDSRRTARGQLEVRVGDHVVVSGEQLGHVRYLGHLDVSDGEEENPTVFVGLELDAPVGRTDGCLRDKRYFTCAPTHGLFVTLADVICVITRTQEVTSYPLNSDRAPHGEWPVRPPRATLSTKSTAEATNEVLQHVDETQSPRRRSREADMTSCAVTAAQNASTAEGRSDVKKEKKERRGKVRERKLRTGGRSCASAELHALSSGGLDSSAGRDKKPSPPVEAWVKCEDTPSSARGDSGAMHVADRLAEVEVHNAAYCPDDSEEADYDILEIPIECGDVCLSAEPRHSSSHDEPVVTVGSRVRATGRLGRRTSRRKPRSDRSA